MTGSPRPLPDRRSPPAAYAAIEQRHPVLVLPFPVYRQIVLHLAGCLPNEGVGLLAVQNECHGLHVDHYYPGVNADASPVRYTMSPIEVTAALRQMERRGTRLGAIVHSHPRTPPVPSQTDLAEARFPGTLSVIVGFEPTVSIRVWELEFDDVGAATRSREVRVAIVGRISKSLGANGKRTILWR